MSRAPSSRFSTHSSELMPEKLQAETQVGEEVWWFCIAGQLEKRPVYTSVRQSLTTSGLGM